MKKMAVSLWVAVWICLLTLLSASASQSPSIVQVSISQDSNLLTVFLTGMTDTARQPCTVGSQSLMPAASGSATDSQCQVYTTVLFDTSTSIPEGLRQSALDLLNGMIESKADNDAYQLVTFGDQVSVLQAYTTDRYDLAHAAGSIQFTGQQSKLYDAVYQNLSHPQAQDGTPTLYRIIVISDGIDDTATGITGEELMLHLEDGNVPVDVVVIGDTQSESKELSALARLSAGRCFSLSDSSQSQTVAQALSLDAYSYLQFALPSALLDGAVRQITIGGIQTDVRFPAIAQSTPAASTQPIPTPTLSLEMPFSSLPIPSFEGQLSPYLILGIVVAVLLLVVVLLLLHRRSTARTRACQPPEQPLQNPPPYKLSRDEATVYIPDGVYHTIQLRNTKTPEQVWNLPVTDTLTLGRAEHCEIQLSNPSVSREQCKIAVQDGSVMLIPLECTNRTICNGRPITAPWPLQSGDILKFGHEVLQVEAIQVVGAAGDAMLWNQQDVDKTEAIFRENTK